MHPARGSERRPAVWPPEEVRQVTAMFLDLVDDAAPGLVEGLHLHGSLGFGEWYVGCSDVDFVAVLAHRPDDAERVVLREAHARVGDTFPRPPFDGFHCTREDLARPAYLCPDVPCVQAGRWFDADRRDVDPVTWHELAWHGVTVRGPAPAEGEVWTDRAVLRDHTRENLRTYWTDALAALRQEPERTADPAVMTWFVLGAPRLHHLLATGRLTSKNGAGHHVVSTFGGRWRPVVAEALAHRAIGERTGMYDGAPDRLAEDVIGLTALVVQDGLALPG